MGQVVVGMGVFAPEIDGFVSLLDFGLGLVFNFDFDFGLGRHLVGLRMGRFGEGETMDEWINGEERCLADGNKENRRCRSEEKI